MFETASLIRSLADKTGIRLIGYCDGIMASAAYGLGCVCHELILNPSSECGSIGVVVRLRNANKGLKQAGIEDSFVFAGSEKIPYDKSGDWSASFIAELQNKVDTLYGEFTNFVSKYRGISVKDVVATNAKMFTAKDALKIGLADKLMTREELANYLKAASIAKPTAVATPIAEKAEAAPQKPLTKAEKWKGVVNDPTPKTTMNEVKPKNKKPYITITPDDGVRAYLVNSLKKIK